MITTPQDDDINEFVAQLKLNMAIKLSVKGGKLHVTLLYDEEVITSDFVHLDDIQKDC